MAYYKYLEGFWKTNVQLKPEDKMENKSSNLEQTPPFCKADVSSSKRYCTTDLLNAYQAGAVEMYNKIVNSIEKQTLKGLREDSQEWLKLYDK